MNRHHASHFAPKQTTGADQQAALVSQLFCCRPHMLDLYTLEELQRRYPKVQAKVVEYELIRARQHRKDEAR